MKICFLPANEYCSQLFGGGLFHANLQCLKTSPLPTFWKRWADFTVRRSRAVLCIVILLTGVFAYFLTHLEMGTNVRSFHRKDALNVIETVEDGFDEGTYLSLIFESQSDKSLLTPELLHQQFRIMKEIKKNFNVRTHSLVEGIDEGLKRNKHKSLLEFSDYKPIAEAILALAGGKTVRDLEKVSQHLLSHPEAISFYSKFRITMRMAGGGAGASQWSYEIPFVKAIQAYIQIDPGYGKREQAKIAASIRDLAESLTTPELKVYAISDNLVSYDIDLQGQKNVALMGLILLLVDILFLWGEFRKGGEMLLVLFILTTSCIWTFGMASLFKFQISFLHLIVLPILLGVGIDNSFVFGGRLVEERAKSPDLSTAIRATFAETGTGIFLATVTTLLAFFSSALTSSSQGVRSFNLLVALSMSACLVLTFFLQGAIRAEVAKHRPREFRFFTREPFPSIKRVLDGLYTMIKMATGGFARFGSRTVTRHPHGVLLVGGLLILASLGLSFRIDSQFDRRIFMRKNMPTYHADGTQKKYFGSNKAGYILIEGNVENPVLLQKMRLLEERIKQYPEVEQVLGRANVDSINDLIDKMRIPMTPETSVKDAFDRITANEETANYVLDETYRESAKHLVRKTGGHYDGLVMKFFIDAVDGRRIRAIARGIEREMQTLKFDEIPGIRTRIGGGMISMPLEEGYYFTNFIQSFFVTLGVNFLVLLAVWRKFWQSAAAVTPILFAVIVTLGLMALFDVRLNMLTLCIGSIVVGLGDDYPIHITERFVEERRNGLKPLEAVRKVLSTMGSNIMACAVTSILGFGAACVLAMPVAESFGILTALSLFFVFLAAIFILPVLLVRVK